MSFFWAELVKYLKIFIIWIQKFELWRSKFKFLKKKCLNRQSNGPGRHRVPLIIGKVCIFWKPLTRGFQKCITWYRWRHVNSNCDVRKFEFFQKISKSAFFGHSNDSTLHRVRLSISDVGTFWKPFTRGFQKAITWHKWRHVNSNFGVRKFEKFRKFEIFQKIRKNRKKNKVEKKMCQNS